MKPLFESRYYYPQNNGKGFTRPREVRRPVGERWLARNFDLIEAVAHAGKGLVDLWEASPVRLDSNTPNTEEKLTVSFPATRCFAVAGRITISTHVLGRTGTSCKTYNSSCQVR